MSATDKEYATCDLTSQASVTSFQEKTCLTIILCLKFYNDNTLKHHYV